MHLAFSINPCYGSFKRTRVILGDHGQKRSTAWSKEISSHGMNFQTYTIEIEVYTSVLSRIIGTELSKLE